MDSRLVSERIARMAWIDAVAVPLQKTVGKVYRAMGPVGERIERTLHGDFLGHPLHPVTVHLPIGAWTLAALLDPWGGSLAARMGADLAVAIGVVGALFAAVTGATEYYAYSGTAIRRIGGLHAILNWVAVALYALSWLCRAEGVRDMARLLSYLGFASVGASGYLGGLLVYEKRIGTNHAPIEDEASSEVWTPVARLADLPDGTPHRAIAGGRPLALVREGDTVFVFADRCSHQGGPLSEGRVVDGCLECPWHATRFSLITGKSIGGPGVASQPRYATRVVDGMVEAALPAEEPETVSVPRPGGQATLM